MEENNSANFIPFTRFKNEEISCLGVDPFLKGFRCPGKQTGSEVKSCPFFIKDGKQGDVPRDLKFIVVSTTVMRAVKSSRGGGVV